MSPRARLQKLRILKAIRDDKIARILSLLDGEFPLESVLTDERTALGEALEIGNGAIVSQLLKNGAFIHSGGSQASEMFYIAVQSQWTPIVRILLENGANVNGPLSSSKRENLLHLAVKNQDVETTRLLLEWQADVDMQCFPLGQTLLLAAVKRPSVDRSAEIVKLPLEHGADIDAEGGDGANFIDITVRDRDAPLLKMLLLLRHGALPKLEILHREMLDLAITAGDVEFANILSEDGMKFSSATARNTYVVLYGKALYSTCCSHHFVESCENYSLRIDLIQTIFVFL